MPVTVLTINTIFIFLFSGADFGGQTLGAVGGAVSDSGSGKGASKEPAPTAEEVRARRLAFLEKVDKGSPTQTQQTQENPPQVAAQENGEGKRG